MRFFQDNVLITICLVRLLSAVGVSEAFTTSLSSSSAVRRIFSDGLDLYVADKGNGEYAREEPEIKAKNDWGIPDSKTLEPFCSQPKAQLENGAKITLVGSGPGDPDLLTRKAYNLLQDPDSLVICDRLVSSEIIDLIKGEVKVARKMPGCAELAQEEIYWWAHQGLAQGKHVIRLKIGDPFVFGRGGEEVITFRRFGVESAIVPVSFEKITTWRRLHFFLILKEYI